MNSERLREERWKSARQPIGLGNEGLVETSMCMFVFKGNLSGITLQIEVVFLLTNYFIV